jgi:hypothetical protein
MEIFMSTNPMTTITLKLTREEAELLTSLVSDQLFRREFIDPKMPGFKSNISEMTLGKALVARLRSIVDPDRAQRTLPAKVAR